MLSASYSDREYTTHNLQGGDPWEEEGDFLVPDEMVLRDYLIQRFQRNGNPLAGSTDPHSAGNGCIMRLVPVPIRYVNQPELAVQYSVSNIFDFIELSDDTGIY